MSAEIVTALLRDPALSVERSRRSDGLRELGAAALLRIGRGAMRLVDLLALYLPTEEFRLDEAEAEAECARVAYTHPGACTWRTCAACIL